MKQKVSLKMGDGHIVNKKNCDSNNVNEIFTSNSFENLIFSELQEISLKGITIDQHSNIVTNVSGNFYKGFDKGIYKDVLEALQTIIESRRNHVRRCNKQKEAIAFLHLEIKFSPTLIRNMVALFGIKLEISKILKISNDIFEKMQQPIWLQNINYVGLC